MPTVLITGTSTGIGRATALLLAQRNFRIFAGIRRPEDAHSLRRDGGPSLVPIELDVTNEAAVAAAARQVGSLVGPGGLDALINNAGIGHSAPLEHVAMDDVRRQFDVDVFGPIAVTKAFLPLLRRAGGREVNIGSVGGHLAIPFGGALSACKSALGAISDALRLELHPFGIHVIVIEPGSVNTPAANKMVGDVDAIIRALPPEGVAQYEQMLRRSLRIAYDREKRGSPPEVVAHVIYRALTDPHPRTRYRVGKDARLLYTLARILPDGILDRLRMRILGIPRGFGALGASSHQAPAHG
jgi:NAD(P)-dependent dehydrogenase (short-subunit alcohol dehydrogenase family)